MSKAKQSKADSHEPADHDSALRTPSEPERTPSRRPHSALKKARYIMIGGFLGAGKTTAIAKLAKRLTEQGQRVGLITNDQGNELVDTAMLRSHGFATEEIPGGCFCCRFNSLVEAAERLAAATTPDVFIAEPVGSCTDLVATVTYPLRRIYGDNYSIAPLSVLVDPVRALRILGLAEGGKFSPKVSYIYRKQLEEADIIVINKCDLLEPDRLKTLSQALSENFPQAELYEVSARNAFGLESWFERITATEQEGRAALDVDYELYAEGEALLGWLNATVELSAPKPFDGNEVIKQLSDAMQQELKTQGAEIAHLKMTLSPDKGLGGLAVVNLVRNDYVSELSQVLSDPVQRGQVIVNIRAEASPDLLHGALTMSLEACRQAIPQLTCRIEHLEHFRPGKPQPTHRITTLS